jgi:hypothetical protein
VLVALWMRRRRHRFGVPRAETDDGRSALLTGLPRERVLVVKVECSSAKHCRWRRFASCRASGSACL